MRLGIVGTLPNDFRAISYYHLEILQGLGLTGAAFHRDGETLTEIRELDCRRIRNLYHEAGMDLPQFGIGYRECLFDPDAAVRKKVIDKIARGIEVARALDAHHCLIRTGSLNGRGSYSATPANHTPEAHALLIESLGKIAQKAEEVDQVVVIETHLLTIMNSPETNVAVIDEVGSEHLRIVMDYVNHFQTLEQVHNSAARINHIFDSMGAICPVGHCKDIRIGDGLVLHIDEEIPGEGVLDLPTVLRRWHALRPDGYMLLEHLHADHEISPPDHPGQKLGWSPQQMATFDLYTQAARNVHRIAGEAGVPIQ